MEIFSICFARNSRNNQNNFKFGMNVNSVAKTWKVIPV